MAVSRRARPGQVPPEELTQPRRRLQGGRGGHEARFGQADDSLRVLEELKRAGAVRAEATEEELDEADKKADGEANRARHALKAAPSAPATGGGAVAKSLGLRMLSKDSRARGRSGALGILSRRIKDRNFHLVEGVWIDSRFKPAMRGKARKIKAFSYDYFTLVKTHPELAPFLAFSTRIVIVHQGEAIEIVEA